MSNVLNEIRFLRVMQNNPHRSATVREAIRHCADSMEQMLAVVDAVRPLRYMNPEIQDAFAKLEKPDE